MLNYQSLTRYLLAWTLFMLFGLYSSTLYAQANFSIDISENPYAKFNRITVNDGLSHKKVLDLHYDSYNYMWFCTVDGLNKYDGFRIKVYRNSIGDTNSLPGNLITCIEETSDSTLWIGTNKGVCTYDRKKDRFIRFRTFDTLINNNHIKALFADGDSLLWIDTEQGHLIKYSLFKKEVLKVYKHNPGWQKYYHYQDVFRDSEEQIWFGGRGLLPMRLDEKSNKFIGVSIGEEFGQKRTDDLACFFEDSKNQFWMAALDGVYLYDRENDIFTNLLGVSSYSIVESKNKKIWIGSGDGAFSIDLESGKTYHYRYDMNNEHSLPSEYINKICIDPNGNIWFATGNGVAVHQESDDHIKHYMHIAENHSTLSSNRITDILEDSRSDIWISTKDAGLNQFHRADQSFTHYHPNENGNSIASNRVKCLYEDSKGDIYIGLWDGVGFNIYDHEKKSFSLNTYYPKDRTKDWYNDFAEDNEGNFYVGFWGADGLTIFNRQNQSFDKTLRNKFSLSFESRLISKLFYDREGRLWVGTSFAGLHIYYPDKDTSSHFFHLEDINSSFENLIIYDILESTDGTIWIAADSLYSYNKQGKFEVYGRGKGLPVNNVYSLLEDKDGILWLGTERGIIGFDPNTGISRSYSGFANYIQDANSNAAYKLKSGELVFGGTNGFVIFNPQKAKADISIPDIFLTELKVKGTTKIPELSGADKINLKFDENYFSILFSNTDLASAGKFIYRYILEGFDESWHIIENGRPEASYNNLPYGRYTLTIQMARIGTDWNRIKMVQVDIRIKSPIWLRWWFILILALGLVITLFIVWRNRHRKVLLNIKNAELNQQLLRAQINPHFIFNALTSIQAFIYNQKNLDAGRYLSNFSRLMRMVLNNSSVEFITLEKELETLKNYIELQHLRFNGKFQYTINIENDIDASFVEIPSMLTQPFVENAIEHGLAHKEEKGFLSVKVSMNGKVILIEIEDNGIGRMRSAELNLKRSKEHKSMGMEITEQRLSILKKKYGINIRYEVMDLKDANDISTGTKVVFEVPYIND